MITAPSAAAAPPESEQPAMPTGTTAGTTHSLAAQAVDLARTAAEQAAAGDAAVRGQGGSGIGEHLGVQPEPAQPGEDVVTHLFASTARAYVGWRWAVTVARAEGRDAVTVDEVVLLPGADALVAPAWVPWNERVQPGDLSPGDLLPPRPDDDRLVPAYAEAESELAEEVDFTLGLGRARVLSREGRADAAERWWDGPGGPFAPVAKAAPGQCVDCGFLVTLGGALRSAFGVCANALAPDDGRVVALTHGCGAHSEAAVEVAVVVPAGDDEYELELSVDAQAASGDGELELSVEPPPAPDHDDELSVDPPAGPDDDGLGG